MNSKFGIIGGSGFYQPEDSNKVKKIKTPFGEVTAYFGKMGEEEVMFVPRHGASHSIPPHKINYRANIYAFHLEGVKRIISSSAVGAIDKSLTIGDFLLADQFIDFTTATRAKTFFDGDFEVELSSGEIRGGIVHADFTHPYCSDIREKLFMTAKKSDYPIHSKGTYVCTEGPRFETPAEIKAFRVLGGTVVGMTSVTECILARELGLCYATICLITNYAAGLQEGVSSQEVFNIFDEKISDITTLINETLPLLYPENQENCYCLG